MGLDMDFYAVPKDEDPKECEHKIHIKYFRKHSDLHGWLRNYWHSEKAFNCVFLQITAEILEDLKKYLRRKNKTRYEGFFWGQSTKEQWDETKALVKEIEEWAKDGYDVYYYSWW